MHACMHTWQIASAIGPLPDSFALHISLHITLSLVLASYHCAHPLKSSLSGLQSAARQCSEMYLTDYLRNNCNLILFLAFYWTSHLRSQSFCSLDWDCLGKALAGRLLLRVPVLGMTYLPHFSQSASYTFKAFSAGFPCWERLWIVTRWATYFLEYNMHLYIQYILYIIYIYIYIYIYIHVTLSVCVGVWHCACW